MHKIRTQTNINQLLQRNSHIQTLITQHEKIGWIAQVADDNKALSPLNRNIQTRKQSWHKSGQTTANRGKSETESEREGEKTTTLRKKRNQSTRKQLRDSETADATQNRNDLQEVKHAVAAVN